MENGWHSAAVIWKRVNGRYKFLVQDSLSLDPAYAYLDAQTKCIGGGKEGSETDPLQTLLRELSEELALEIGGKIQLRTGAKPLQIWANSKGRHTQYFYLISAEDLIGEMRRTKTMRRDGKSMLYNLRFIDEGEIENVYRTHQNALRIALGVLRNIPQALVG